MRASNLQLVKSLSYLKEERKYSEETTIESDGFTFSRGAVNELVGSATVGKSSIACSLLAKLTQNGEICAVVDTVNSFDPCTAILAGVCLENLLWAKCNNDVEKAFNSTDYLIQAKGFGAIWLNLSNVSLNNLRFIPRSYWYRFRTKVRDTPTIFLVTSGAESIAGSAATNSYLLTRKQTVWSGIGRFKLLREFHLRTNSRKQFQETIFSKIECSYNDV